MLYGGGQRYGRDGCYSNRIPSFRFPKEVWCARTFSLAFRVGLLKLTIEKTSVIKSSLKHPLCAGFVFYCTVNICVSIQ